MASREVRFCPYCGTKVDAGSRFCKNCGEVLIQAQVSDDPSASEAGQAKRESVYDGKIHKCPNCGEVLGAFVAICPSCGYELRETKSANSVREFSLKLENSKSIEHSITLIRNFPVPNTKEDVFEFMILASSNILSDIPQKVRDAWRAKFEQSYQKAKLLFDGREELSRINYIYQNTLSSVDKEKLKNWLKIVGNVMIKIVRSVWVAVVKLAPLLVGFAGMLLKNMLFILGILSYCKAIQIDRVGDNGAGYELLGGLLIVIASFLLVARIENEDSYEEVGYIELGIGVACVALTFYLANFLENGSGLQLSGGFTAFIILIGFVARAMK